METLSFAPPPPPPPPFAHFYDCNGEIVFVTDKMRAKIPQKPNYESKKIRILEENRVNSKLKHRKAHNSNLSGDPSVPDNSGELACMN